MARQTVGYSGTPLAKKLGFKPGFRVLLDGKPDDYSTWIEPLPDDVAFVSKSARGVDLVHLFTDKKADLRAKLPKYMKRIKPDGMIWVSWPKKASGVPTDITEDVIREVALPLGLVDVKVCAVSEIWSGLKLVIRVELRKRYTHIGDC